MVERYYPYAYGDYTYYDPTLRAYRPYYDAPYYRREYYDPVLRAYRPLYDSPARHPYYPVDYPYSRTYWDSVTMSYRPLSCDYKYWDPVYRNYRYSPYYYDRYPDYRLYSDRLVLDRPYYRYDPVYRCERIWDPVSAIYVSALPSLPAPCKTACEILAESKAADLAASAARASRFASTAPSSRQYAYSASPAKRLRESNAELSRHY
jgi:hypothetical protein